MLVVSFGRLGDMFGRVRMFNLGFAIFALFSVLLSVTWLHGTAAAWWLIAMRILQAVGGGGRQCGTAPDPVRQLMRPAGPQPTTTWKVARPGSSA